MAGFSAPSFSLGLDLDLDLDLDADSPYLSTDDEEQEELRPSPAGGALPSDGCLEEEDGEEALNDLGVCRDEPPRALKRLRRGLPPDWTPPVTCAAGEYPLSLAGDADDEIEESSSPLLRRRRDHCSSLLSHSSCGSSKFSLHCHGFLTSQAASKLRVPKSVPASCGSTAMSYDADSNKKLFPKFTISPLRKIRLLDSDSDDPSPSKGKYKPTEVDASPERRPYARAQTISEQKKIVSKSKKPIKENLWKNFRSKQSRNIATPALDEFCEEYFSSMKDPKGFEGKKMDISSSSSTFAGEDDFADGLINNKGKIKNAKHQWDLLNLQPPAYRYFYHDDSTIRALICHRLPYFVPLDAVNHNGNKQFETDDLDYIYQFGTRDIPRQIHNSCEGDLEGSSKIRKWKEASGKVKVASNATTSWVNPRSQATIPKDAGKRRVRADGRQSGHWFTGEDGRKVYVSKSGRELTGRVAYRHYRKESGTGFKTATKKAAGKKKRKR